MQPTSDQPPIGAPAGAVPAPDAVSTQPPPPPRGARHAMPPPMAPTQPPPTVSTQPPPVPKQQMAAADGTRPPSPAPSPSVPPPPPASPQSLATLPPGQQRPVIVVLLAVAGVALLATAAVAFTAMTWSRLPLAAQAGVLGFATLAAIIGAATMHRRKLPIVASAVGVLAAILGAVDVIALQRSGLVDLGAHVAAFAAVAALVVAWILARLAVRGAHWSGGVATIIAVISANISIASEAGLDPEAFVLVGVALAWVGMFSGLLWRRGAPRIVVSIAMIAWITLLGLIAAVAISALVVDPASGAIAARAAAAGAAAASLVAIAALQMSLWWPHHRWALAPAVLVATTSAGALSASIAAAADSAWWSGEPMALSAAVVAVIIAGLAQAAVRLSGVTKWAIVVGLAPAALAVTVIVSVAAMLGALELSMVGGEFLPPRSSPWILLATAGVAGAIDAWPPARRFWHLAGAVTVLVALSVLPSGSGWPVAGAYTVVLVGAFAGRLPRRRSVAVAAMAGTVATVVLSTSEAWTLMIAAGLGAAGAGVLAWATWRDETPDVAVRNSALILALVSGGIAAGAMVVTVGVGDRYPDAPLMAALLVSHLAAWIVAYRARRRDDQVTVVIAIIASLGTVAILWAFPAAAPFGWLLVASGAGWLALSEFDFKVGLWIGSILTVIGLAVIIVDARIDAVEVVTVPIALVLGTLTARRVLAHAQRSSAVLWPALAIGFAPSIVLLALDPTVLWRALGVVVVAGLVVTAGLRRSLLAPVVAGSIAAIAAALTQVGIVWQVVPRWITFAVVGAILIRLAATYERQRQRAVIARQRLADLR